MERKLTIDELESLRCLRKHSGLHEAPMLRACMSRGGWVMALMCPVCHKFYAVVEDRPIKYPEHLLPGYVPPPVKHKMTHEERGIAMRKKNLFRHGAVIGANLRMNSDSWHDIYEVAEMGVLSMTVARNLLDRLKKYCFVVEGHEKHNGRKRKTRVWQLVPTWRDVVPCDHDELCKGFWHGVKTGTWPE